MATTLRGAEGGEAVPRTRSHLGRIDALLFLMALIWAVNFSVLKYGTRQIEPLAYNGLRIPLAAMLQLILARAMRVAPVSRRDAVTLVLLGLLGNGVYQVLFILGVARTTVATTVLILASGPALVGILGRIRGTEFLTRQAWIGVGLQLGGVLLVVLGTAGAASGTDSLLGGLLVLGAAASWAYFSVQVKPLSERVAGLQIGGYTMLGGALVTVTAGIPSLARTHWSTVPVGAYWALAYSGIAAMVIAYLIWYYGVKVIGPTRTSMYANMQPVIAMAVAWVFLAERPSSWQVAGAVSITSGLLLARTASHEPEAP